MNGNIKNYVCDEIKLQRCDRKTKNLRPKKYIKIWSCLSQQRCGSILRNPFRYDHGLCATIEMFFSSSFSYKIYARMASLGYHVRCGARQQIYKFFTPDSQAQIGQWITWTFLRGTLSTARLFCLVPIREKLIQKFNIQWQPHNAFYSILTKIKSLQNRTWATTITTTAGERP